MRMFITDYTITSPIGTHHFGSYVWAEDRAAAERLCLKRGIGEVIQSEAGADPAAATVPGLGDRHLYHWLCFLSFVALKAGYSPEAILGDAGVVHEMIHRKDGIDLVDWNADPAAKYLELCAALGFLPPGLTAPFDPAP